MSVLISLQQISKTYDSGGSLVHAVRSVSLDFAAGEFIAIMGASGSGKSTLMNILGCLDRPTSGKYFLDGEDVSTLKRDQLADVRNRKIGFVFQGFNLLARTTALENVELPMLYFTGAPSRRQMRDKAMAMLEMVGLGERWDHTPNRLSGGQQQRVAIARTLAMNPEAILFDEPTSALDPRTTADVISVMTDLAASGQRMIVVTHAMSFARTVAHQVHILHAGRIAESGPPEQIFEDPQQAITREFLSEAARA